MLWADRALRGLLLVRPAGGGELAFSVQANPESANGGKLQFVRRLIGVEKPPICIAAIERNQLSRTNPYARKLVEARF